VRGCFQRFVESDAAWTGVARAGAGIALAGAVSCSPALADAGTEAASSVTTKDPSVKFITAPLSLRAENPWIRLEKGWRTLISLSRHGNDLS
jgi:hypothetical protein